MPTPPDAEAAATTDTRAGADADTRRGASRTSAAYRPSAAAWLWVPTLYFAEGVPYEVVNNLSGIMYVLLGIDNARMTWYTGLLYLPWVIKPLWSPLVDVIGTQRRWIVGTQLLMAAGFAGVALTTPTSAFFFATLCFFWLLAFSSATHDIAADGFYMHGLSDRDQAWFVGIRSTFYRMAMFFVAAVLLALAGVLDDHMPKSQAWAIVFAVTAGLYVLLGLYHALALPPQVRREASPSGQRRLGREFVDTFASFFRKPGIGMALAYMLLYRFSEAQLAKLARPFMFAAREEGGLALSEETVALIYGTVGLAMLTTGGILGGIILANQGLRRWLLPMALALNVPNLLYVLLAAWQPTSTVVVGAAVAVEQFGYGFGFAAYLLFMLRFARGEHQTAHYALCTGFMALGMMLPGMISGMIEEAVGYLPFFIWVLVATIPSLAVTMLVRVEEEPSGDPAEGAEA